MRTCAVCFRRSDRAENKSFHRLPLYKPELYMAWLRAMRYRDADAPVRVLRRRDIRLCDDHFSPDDLIQGAEHKSLREGAVPSIFPWTPAEPGAPLQDQRRKDVACQSSQTQDNWTMTTLDLESKENKGQNGVISDSRQSHVLRWADTSVRGARGCLSASTSVDDGHYLVDLESFQLQWSHTALPSIHFPYGAIKSVYRECWASL
ncbi:THAP domain-containing protein 4-like isoform X2 [Myripristis murdjan]|uniref:THAP domain-containing protein 4-like isoform X2 n=1 Tax=Myripristis murdjan TaxID=586833 RepID=UPI0011763AF7|nr:THAP domain-containing protein 4-like isoform X2 [Myripristis murdjan]